MNWFDVTLRWYLVTLLATLAWLPLTVYVFRKIADRGAAFARPIAALMTLWPVWFLSGITGGLVPWTGPVLWTALILLAVANWFLAIRHKLITRLVWRHVIVAEAGFVTAFGGFLWLRGFGPMTNWQEKPSDLMMISSVMMSDSIPPNDAWLSGHSINYYYVGHAIWGAFGKMIGIMPGEVFNLALITTFAMVFVAATGVAANVLAHFYDEWTARAGGIIAALALLVLGNPWSAWQIWFEGGNKLDYWAGIGWNASRTIRDSSNPEFTHPISEFPAFSFILGDLHPHVLALPFTVLSLGIAWLLLSLGRVESGTLIRRDWLRLLFAGAIFGSLYAINSWDFPTYLLIGLLALALGSVGRPVSERLQAAGIVIASSIIAWLPFYLHFQPPSAPVDSALGRALNHIPIIGGVLGSIGVYDMQKTSAAEFFEIFGVMYAVFIILLIVETVRRRDDRVREIAARRGTQWTPDPMIRNAAIVAAFICLAGALFLPAQLLVLCGLPVVLAWLLLERDIRLTPANIAMVLCSLALILLLIPEFFYINDYYGGIRMNTVFKVTYQVWTIMAIGSAIAVIAIWRAVHRTIPGKVLVPLGVAAMLVIGSVYPIVGARQWLDWRSPDRTWHGIDGMDYLRDANSPYLGEYEAIEWFLTNAGPDDVVLTAGGGEWDFSLGRVSSATGVPTLLGWTGHENQWHLGDDAWLIERDRRINDVATLYNQTPNPELVNAYGITYLYIGPTETYGPELRTVTEPNAGPFPNAQNPEYPGPGWTEVFNQNGSRIYRWDGN